MCLILVIKIIISITGFMRGISLFNRRLISRQYCILVWVTEQEMPKDLDRRDYESNERIVSGRERISHIFSLLISVCIVVWIHMESVPWSKNIFSIISKEVKKIGYGQTSSRSFNYNCRLYHHYVMDVYILILKKKKKFKRATPYDSSKF